MSNLSDLLPAGASGKTIEAVATANITSKAPVILNSAGTVTQVAETAVAAAINDLETVSAGTQTSVDWCYDTSEDKVVLIYANNANSGYPFYVVGTVTSQAVSWSTPTAVYSRAVGQIGVCYQTVENRIVMCTKDSNLPKAIVGTLSGSTITWGSVVTILNPAGSTPHWDGNTVVEWPGTSKVLFATTEQNQYYAYAVAGTISGSGASATSVWGTAVAWGGNGIANRPTYPQIVYDAGVGDQIIIFWKFASTNGQAIAASVSGTTISFGTPVVVVSSNMGDYVTALAYDTTNNKGLVVYGTTYSSGGNLTNSRVVSTSGTTITLGTETAAVFNGTSAYGSQYWRSLTYIPTFGNFVIFYQDAPGQDGYATTVSISGTTPVWSNDQTSINGNETPDGNNIVAYDPDTEQAILAYRDKGTGPQYLRTGVYTIPASVTNLTATNFVGIADAAISSSATGTVVVQGGTITGLSSLTTGSKYYVQDDGTVTTVSSSVNAGLAISTTSLLLNGDS